MSSVSTPSGTSMPSLLGIPREVRLLIIEYVLHSQREAPIKPSKSDRNPILHTTLLKPLAPYIYIPQRRTRSPPNCLPLLLTNRQISTETQTVLHTMKTTYKLDLSILNDLTLYPTWLSIPRLTTRLSTLHIDVRLFGHVLYAKGYQRPCPMAIHWGIYLVLARFFRSGPVGEVSRPHSMRHESGDFTVKTLVLDFRSAETRFPFPPEEITYDDWCELQMGLSIRRGGIGANGDRRPRYKTPPRWLAEWTSSQLRKSGGYPSVVSRRIMLSHVGVVMFLVEGELFEQFDIAKDLEYVGSGERHFIMKERKRLGLPVASKAKGPQEA